MFDYLLGELNPTVSWCVATPEHDVLSSIAFDYMTDDAIAVEFSRQVSLIFYVLLLFPRVDFTTTLVNELT